MNYLAHSMTMGESLKFPKSRTFETSILKLAVCPQKFSISSLNGQLSLDRLYINRKTYYRLPNSASMESQAQNPEFRNNPENFHPCMTELSHIKKMV